MGCITSSSYCLKPFLDNYLHIKIESVEGLRVKGDLLKYHDRGELYIRVRYKGKRQSTNIHNVHGDDFVLNENLILNGVKPCKSGNHLLTIELLDYDSITGNDLLGSVHIKVPTEINESLARRRYKLKDSNKKTIGYINVAQLHFIKEKINQYNGGCKLFCCLFCCQNVGSFD